MKYIKLIILIVFLNTAFTGCSYVSDAVEGKITNKASFTVTAQYSAGNIILTWDKSDTSQDFAGFEIYRTSEPNDEYATYELVANRFISSPNALSNGLTLTYTVPAPPPGSVTPRTFFYRVGIIYWDDPISGRTTANGYSGPTWDDPASIEYNYSLHTNIDSISGYGKVVVP